MNLLANIATVKMIEFGILYAAGMIILCLVVALVTPKEKS